MTNSIVANLEKLLGGPRDGALLRYSLGVEWAKSGASDKATGYFREALAFDRNYSAAWKQLGKALSDQGQPVEALAAYREGVSVATAKGDLQAAKEMTVFAKRIARQLGENPESGGQITS